MGYLQIQQATELAYNAITKDGSKEALFQAAEREFLTAKMLSVDVTDLCSNDGDAFVSRLIQIAGKDQPSENPDADDFEASFSTNPEATRNTVKANVIAMLCKPTVEVKLKEAFQKMI